MRIRSLRICISAIVIAALVTASGCSRHTPTGLGLTPYPDSHVSRETILKLTEEWSDVPRTPNSTTYRIKNGIGLSSPEVPRLQGPNGPDDIHSLRVHGEANRESLGKWSLSVYMSAEPGEKIADAITMYSGEVLQCGEWVIRISNVVDDGGTFEILAQPDLPPAKY